MEYMQNLGKIYVKQWFRNGKFPFCSKQKPRAEAKLRPGFFLNFPRRQKVTVIVVPTPGVLRRFSRALWY